LVCRQNFETPRISDGVARNVGPPVGNIKSKGTETKSDWIRKALLSEARRIKTSA
jgi:hypothetical protein